MLKSSMAIFLSFTILLQGLNFHWADLAEIEVLASHYKEHQSSFGDNFFTFFEKHYGELRQEHDREEHQGSDEHEKLPFKHDVCQLGGSTLLISPLGQERLLVALQVFSVQDFFYLDNYSFLDQTDIFQPPKFLS